MTDSSVWVADYNRGQLRVGADSFGVEAGVPTTPAMIKKLYGINVPPPPANNLQVSPARVTSKRLPFAHRGGM